MSDTNSYIKSLFTQKNIVVQTNRKNLFEEFVKEESNIISVKQIQENQKSMIDKWILKNKINDIVEKQLIIPNATVNKPYEAILDFANVGMNEIVYTEFIELNEYGLVYNNESETISGNPIKSGDYKIVMKFRIAGEPDNSILNAKNISLVINADPKTLWKDIPSTQSDVNFWKPDNVADFQPLGERQIVVASKRGRSHANVGSFRDDEYAFKYFENNGWSIVCVADGAGSAKLARQGSKIACDGIIEYFSVNINNEFQSQIDDIAKRYYDFSKPQYKDSLMEGSFMVDDIKIADEIEVKINEETELNQPVINEIPKKEVPEAQSEQTLNQIELIDPIQIAQNDLKLFLYNNLGQAAFFVHKNLAEFASNNAITIKDLHSTLIFSLFKKYEFGYVILSFGVGDCPIGLLNKDMSEIKLMNWLDVGEFGGGTRFITMPEIFSSDKFSSRFGFKLIDDFSYLMLMTDGIYDPKFVVEANLEKIEKWKEFLEDLKGNNEENIKVEFDSTNLAISSQLSSWMDFWSAGNHDDRTLAIVF